MMALIYLFVSPDSSTPCLQFFFCFSSRLPILFYYLFTCHVLHLILSPVFLLFQISPAKYCFTTSLFVMSCISSYFKFKIKKKNPPSLSQTLPSYPFSLDVLQIRCDLLVLPPSRVFCLYSRALCLELLLSERR